MAFGARRIKYDKGEGSTGEGTAVLESEVHVCRVLGKGSSHDKGQESGLGLAR